MEYTEGKKEKEDSASEQAICTVSNSVHIRSIIGKERKERIILNAMDARRLSSHPSMYPIEDKFSVDVNEKIFENIDVREINRKCQVAG